MGVESGVWVESLPLVFRCEPALSTKAYATRDEMINEALGTKQRSEVQRSLNDFLTELGVESRTIPCLVRHKKFL